MRTKLHVAMLLLVVGSPLLGQSSTRELSSIAYWNDAFQLTPGAPAASRPITIDSTPSFYLQVIAASRTLTVSIVGPNGRRYTVGDVATADAETAFVPIDASKPSGQYFININNPLAGTWMLQVAETAILSGPLDVLASTTLANNRLLVLAGGGDDFPAGSDTRLSLAAFDGTARVRNVTIDAKLIKPGDPAFAPVAVTFRDDGAGADQHPNDGMFEAFVNPGGPGRYVVEVDATATTGGGSFRRSATADVRVVPRNAQIIAVSDHGVDDNSDGMFDRIVIQPAANIVEAAKYIVMVRLVASNGAELQHSMQAAFDIGSVSPGVSFSADEIKETFGVDGPYSIAEVRYYEVTPAEVRPADIRFNLGSTAAYTLVQLQHRAVRLAGITGTGGWGDFNHNNQFDFFEITYKVEVDLPGRYDESATLYDANGREIGFATSWDYFFEAGTHETYIDFDARPIGAGKLTGPFYVRNLIFSGPNIFEPQVFLFRDAFATGTIDPSIYEGYVADNPPPPPPPDTTPPAVTLTVTPTVLYPPNHKMVEITIHVSATDDRDSHPLISLESITSNEAADWRGDGHTSPDIDVQGARVFLRSERSGPGKDRVYTITYAARDAAGNIGRASATVTVPHDQKK
jgi:hypothetical protein